MVWPGAQGSLLVLDRDSATLCDLRVVAHIPADEPRENALLVCRMYMEEDVARPCRQLAPDDLVRAPLPSLEEQALVVEALEEQALAVEEMAGGEMEGEEGEGKGDRDREGVKAYGLKDGGGLLHEGLLYGIRPHRPGRGHEAPELRWSRRAAAGAGPWTALTLRDVLAAFEDYEPMRCITLRALAREDREDREGREGVSAGMLRRELARVQHSALVLNRGLREAVLDAVQRRDVSLSEIALRCGMVKRDRRGVTSGDTTWLARRVGLAPESGRQRPTRWVHSDVLGLIARRGLGLSPREVELG